MITSMYSLPATLTLVAIKLLTYSPLCIFVCVWVGGCVQRALRDTSALYMSKYL